MYNIFIYLFIYLALKFPGMYVLLNLGIALMVSFFILLATSVDVQHIFSQGYIVLSYL